MKPKPLWKQLRDAKIAANPAPGPEPGTKQWPGGRIDEAAITVAPQGCVWQRDPDSGLSGWVYGM